MHSTFANYFATLGPWQTIRWAFAGLIFNASIRLGRLGAKCLPERHPAKGYIAYRADVMDEKVAPSLSLGLPPWAKQIGQALALTALAVVIALALVGAAHTSHHVQHRHDANVHPLDMLR